MPRQSYFKSESGLPTNGQPGQTELGILDNFSNFDESKSLSLIENFLKILFFIEVGLKICKKLTVLAKLLLKWVWIPTISWAVTVKISKVFKSDCSFGLWGSLSGYGSSRSPTE